MRNGLQAVGPERVLDRGEQVLLSAEHRVGCGTDILEAPQPAGYLVAAPHALHGGGHTARPGAPGLMHQPVPVAVRLPASAERSTDRLALVGRDLLVLARDCVAVLDEPVRFLADRDNCGIPASDQR